MGSLQSSSAKIVEIACLWAMSGVAGRGRRRLAVVI